MSRVAEGARVRVRVRRGSSKSESSELLSVMPVANLRPAFVNSSKSQS